MKNEKLQAVAHQFADLTKELYGAKLNVSQAQNHLANIQTELGKLRTQMREYVDANKPNRVESTPAGTVTISHNSATSDPDVRLFDSDGEEIES